MDTAGQEEYTTLRDQWIREGEGYVLVYSITSRSSFSRIRTFYNQILRVKEDGDPYSIVIVGNKSDRGSDEREVSTQEGEALAKELGNLPFFESSAKYNVNIEDAFLTCAKLCKKQRQGPSTEESKDKEATNDQSDPKSPKSKTQPDSEPLTTRSSASSSDEPNASAKPIEQTNDSQDALFNTVNNGNNPTTSSETTAKNTTTNNSIPPPVTTTNTANNATRKASRQSQSQKGSKKKNKKCIIM